MLNELKWLIDSDGQATLSDATAWLKEGVPLTSLAKRLRKVVSSERAQLVLDTVQLRIRGKAKFSQSESMLFTRLGLEQSTSESIGRWKAKRFPKNETVHDLCCGIGGDLIGLATRGPVIGIDRDEVISFLAEHNAHHAYRCADVATHVASIPDETMSDPRFDPSSFWHLDPDRRTQGKRTVSVDLFSPKTAQIEAIRQYAPNGAIKMAPASVCPETWFNQGERQFVGDAKECKQQIIWFGELADQEGRRSAVIVGSNPKNSSSFKDRETLDAASYVCDDGDDSFAEVAPTLGEFLYEPHPALLAANLVSSFARRFGLGCLAIGHVWMTSDERIDHPMVSRFRLLSQTPLRESKIKALLHEFQIGKIETKIHGLHDCQHWLSWKWKSSASSRATLLLTRLGEKRLALLCQRESIETAR